MILQQMEIFSKGQLQFCVVHVDMIVLVTITLLFIVVCMQRMFVAAAEYWIP